MKTSTIVRKVFAAGDMVRDAGLKTPEDVQRFDDIVYGEDKVAFRNQVSKEFYIYQINQTSNMQISRS